MAATVEARHDSFARQRLEVDGFVQRQAQLVGLLDDGLGNMMLAQRLGAGRHAQQILDRVIGERVNVGHYRAARRQRARLVEGDDVGLAHEFQIGAALEKDTLPRRRGDRAQRAGRRADDERTWARHDQQRHGAVECRREGLVQKEVGQDHGQQRGADDGVGIGLAEAVDKLLGRRGIFARILDQCDDPAQRRLRCELGDLDLQRTAAIDRAGKDLVAQMLADRQALARDGALVDAAVAADDDAVHGQAIARFDQHHIADDQLLDGQDCLAPIAAHQGGGRPQLAERLDGLARTAHGVGLQRATQREEEEQQGALHPLIDQRCAQRRGQHQEVDVELAFLGLLPRTDKARVTAGNEGDHRQRCHRPWRQGAGHLAADPTGEQGRQRDAGQHELIVFLPESNRAPGRTLAG